MQQAWGFWLSIFSFFGYPILKEKNSMAEYQQKPTALHKMGRKINYT